MDRYYWLSAWLIVSINRIRYRSIDPSPIMPSFVQYVCELGETVKNVIVCKYRAAVRERAVKPGLIPSITANLPTLYCKATYTLLPIQSYFSEKVALAATFRCVRVYLQAKNSQNSNSTLHIFISCVQYITTWGVVSLARYLQDFRRDSFLYYSTVSMTSNKEVAPQLGQHVKSL